MFHEGTGYPRVAHHRRDPAIATVLTVVFLVAVFVACLYLSMLKVLYPDQHDEEQFVAPAKLLATKGLLPYADCPYLHTPNLVFASALVMRLTDYVLLPARLLSVAFAFALLALLFFVARQSFRDRAPMPRFLIAAGAVLLLLASPLQNHTTGRAWNHDMPMFLAVLAFVLHGGAVKRRKRALMLFLSGLCLGAAITTRISFVALPVPFLAVLFFTKEPGGMRARLPSLFAPHVAGLIVAALPTLVLFALSPARFWYGNVTYHMLEVSWLRELGKPSQLTLLQKLAYAVRVFAEPGNWLPIAGFLGFAWLPAIVRDRERFERRFEVIFVYLLLPFVLVGSFAPSPIFRQYLYAPLPFVAFGIVSVIASMRTDQRVQRRALRWLAALVIACCAYWLVKLPIAQWAYYTRHWEPLRAHAAGLEIRDHVGGGKVLTLAPILPLEGGLDIYPEFASGPFAWRSAHLLPEAQRDELGLVYAGNLDAFLEKDPPAAVLVGFETRFGLEDALIEYARTHGYTPVDLEYGGTLWIAPK